MKEKIRKSKKISDFIKVSLSLCVCVCGCWSPYAHTYTHTQNLVTCTSSKFKNHFYMHTVSNDCFGWHGLSEKFFHLVLTSEVGRKPWSLSWIVDLHHLRRTHAFCRYFVGDIWNWVHSCKLELQNVPHVSTRRTASLASRFDARAFSFTLWIQFLANASNSRDFFQGVHRQWLQIFK